MHNAPNDGTTKPSRNQVNTQYVETARKPMVDKKFEKVEFEVENEMIHATERSTQIQEDSSKI